MAMHKDNTERTMGALKLVYNHPVLCPSLLAVGFSSWKDLCINSDVLETCEVNDDVMVAAGCLKQMASWVRQLAVEDACQSD